jgi:hypothetical protein
MRYVVRIYPAIALTYVTQMQGGCNAARSEAIRRIKQNMFMYLAAGRKPVKIDSQVKDKSSRGLNHPEIGRLLIPAEHLLKWDAHPNAYVHPSQSMRSHTNNISSTRDAFNTGVLQIRGSDMPTFLYDDYAYNPNDPEEGLFRGPFLVCVSAYLL